MTSNVEVDTWEPARLPVAITEMATLATGLSVAPPPQAVGALLGGPKRRRALGRRLVEHDVAPAQLLGEADRAVGKPFIAAVQGQMYNDDFVVNTSRVWVTHLIKTYHDDHSGNIWYRAWAGTAGGVTKSMLASGINRSTSYASTNCNL